jgi:6-pyruvoyltetrahydropterin/6-carboxytetrahydropterin synthase
MAYRSTKRYGHDLGLSACFRQPKATHSHCSRLHGYALAFTFTFEADELDERNWVADFGAFKWLKDALQYHFDHKLLVDANDPQIDEIGQLGALGIADIIVLPGGVGCEKFAKLAFDLAVRCLERDANLAPRVRVISCECAEHGANSAIYSIE